MLIGVDGGGTRTTVALADPGGIEIHRQEGPAGIVVPGRTLGVAESIVAQVRGLLATAGVIPPVDALCAGLAGTGDPNARASVRGVLEREGLARRVVVCSDGEIALEGALAGSAGIILVGGTGSVGWGRSEDGRIDRCGGWGALLGDEGSAYGLARAAITAALRGYDGRGPATSLLPAVMARAEAAQPDELPTWVRSREKAEVAAMAPLVMQAAADGDPVAGELVVECAADLAAHASALAARLGPWSGRIRLALHGGLARQERFAREVAGALNEGSFGFDIRAPVADAVTGALGIARALRERELPGAGDDRE